MPGADFVQPFQIELPGLRGRLVRLGPVVDSALSGHRYPPPVAAILAQALALGAVLASGLKYDGIFTLQLQGDGPLGLVVVDMTSAGEMRGYARFDATRMGAMKGADGAAIPRILGSGMLAFTVDQGPGTERYQGVTPLEGATLSDCAHAYFRQSEQVQTAIRLSTVIADDPPSGPGAKSARAAALMIQRLGGGDAADPEAEESWRRAVALMSGVTPPELLSTTIPPAQVLYRLFHEDGVRLFQPRMLRHRCRCSQRKVERLLATFPRQEILDMAEAGLVAATCEFCKTVYRVPVGGS